MSKFPNRQYVVVALTPGGRTYTYHNDQAVTVRPGDTVEITTPAGATLQCEALEVHNDQPSFNTKPCYKVS